LRAREGGEVVVGVKDDGIGIPEDSGSGLAAAGGAAAGALLR